MTGSKALQSDALEGLVNVVASVFALGAVWYAERPADRGHPFGHGKIEYFSAVFEGGLISLASAVILYESVQGWIRGVEIRNLSAGLAINALAGALNGALGWYLRREGRRVGSEAITADGEHLMTDFVTTLALMAGLGLVIATGWSWLDPLLGVGVALYLALTGYRLVGRAAQALLDAEDPETLKRVVAAFNSERTAEIVAIHEVRALRMGRERSVSLHVAVPENYTVRQGHDVVEAWLARVEARLPWRGEIQFHIDPCERRYCAQCAVAECGIRELPLVHIEPFTVASVVEHGPKHEAGARDSEVARSEGA